MADEKILYDFQGNASSLLNAAQQAIDAMQRIDNAQSQLASSSNPFTPVANALNKVHAQLTTVAAAQEAYSKGINSARAASESLQGSLGGTINSLAITALRMRDAYNAGYAFSGSNNAIVSTVSGVSTALGSLGAQIKNSVQDRFSSTSSAIQGFRDHMSQVSQYAKIFTEGMNPAARAFSYVSTMANEGREAFNQYLGPIIRTRQNLSDTGDAADDAGNRIQNANNRIRDTAKNSNSSNSALKALQKGFQSLGNTVTKMGNNLKSAFNGLKNSTSQLVTSLGFLAGNLSIGKIIGESITASNDYIEALNLFKVSAGDLLPVMQANIDTLEHFGGLSTTTLMTAAGTFKILAQEMGVASTNAAKMSNNLTNVSVDLASMFNKDFNTVMEDLNSGLQGMTKTVRKYGIDISEAALAEIAQAKGIQKNVENMSQAEKMQLRYIAIIQQSSLSQQDFARTIMQPANMLKILKEQIIQCGVAIGNVFQRPLKAILPALIKVTLVVQNLSKALATLTGYKPTETSLPDASAYEAASASAGNLADNTAQAAKNQKKLNNLLGGFDEINALQDPNSSSSGSDTVAVGADLGIALPDYDSLLANSTFMPKLREEADQVAESFKSWAQPILDSFSKIKEAWSPVGTALQNASSTIFPIFAENLQSVITSGFVPFIASIGESLQPLIPVFTDFAATVIPSLSDAFISLSGVAGTFVGAFSNILAGVLPTLSTLITTIVSSFIVPLSNAFQTISQTLGPPFINLFNTIGSSLSQIISVVGPPLIDLFTVLTTSLLPPIIDLVQQIIEAITPMIVTLLPPLIDLFTNVSVLIGDLISAILPPLVDLFNAIIGPVTEIVGALLPPLIDCINRLLGAIVPLLQNVLPPLIKIITAIIKPIMQIIQECLVPIIDIIITILTPILEVIINIIEILLAVLLPIIQVIVNIIDIALQPFIAIIKVLIDIIKWLVDIVVQVFNRIKDVIMGVIRKVIGIFQSCTDMFQKFTDFIRNKLWGTIKNIFQKIGDFINGIFKGIINGIIWVVNKMIDALNILIKAVLSPFNAVIDGLNLVPGVNIPNISLEIPKIPKLALGGVVTEPTTAIIGEGRYDEAVIPLGNSPQMKELVSEIARAVSAQGNGGSSDEVHVHVHIGNEELDEYIVRANRKHILRTNGGY